jgi:hypothetical protein
MEGKVHLEFPNIKQDITRTTNGVGVGGIFDVFYHEEERRFLQRLP